MRARLTAAALTAALALTGASCARRAVSYLGQTPPALTPELFAPGLVSTDAVELNSVFNQDFTEFFFARLVDGTQTMHHAVFERGAWSAARPLLLFPGGTRATADDMSVSPDGQSLYFLGIHPHAQDPEGRTTDIWASARHGGAWSTAAVVPAPISTPASEIYPVVVADGSLYFISNRPGSLGPSDLYRAQRRPDGSFDAPVNVGPPINGEHGTGDAYVSPDERYMIFAARRPSSLGSADLFVSFRTGAGAWTEPVNLGDTINSALIDYCPMVTPDGRYLFFSRRNPGPWAEAKQGDVYWVDARVIDQFRR